MDQTDWGITPQTTDIQDMDKLILKLKQAREVHAEAKRKASEAHAELELVEKDVMNALKSNGRTKFEAENVALVYVTTKEIYTVPKDPANKNKLFDYIKSKYGEDTLLNMMGINYQTLNSWANKEIEADPSLQIPGLDAPTSVETLYFRAK